MWRQLFTRTQSVFAPLGILAMSLSAACGAPSDGDEVTRSEVSAIFEQARVGGLATQFRLSQPATGATTDPSKPTGVLTRAWNGPVVELMYADAWASCSFTADNENASSDDGELEDHFEYLVRSKMMQVTCAGDPPGPSTLGKWFRMRQNPECNRSTVDGSAEGALGNEKRGEVLQRHVIAPLLGKYGTGEQGEVAETLIRHARRGLCVAQVLRSKAPGSAAGAALLLSGAEQRALLELTRERAQIAMHWAASLLTMATSGIQPLLPDSFATSVANLQAWGHDPNSRDAFTQLVNDLSASIQIQTAVTEELADLFLRNAAAHAETGHNAASRAEAEWGPASWRQRLLALLYGGDPLASEDGGAWKDLEAQPKPGDEEPFSTGDWPSPSELPFVRTEAREPQVAALQHLASLYDGLVYKVSPLGVLDVQASGERIYRTVEAALRSQNCKPGSTTCKVIGADDAGLTSELQAGFETFSLWKVHRITPTHARTFAQLLFEIAGTAGATTSAPFVGAMNIGGARTAAGDWYKVAGGSTFTDWRPEQVMPLFSRYASWLMPRAAYQDQWPEYHFGPPSEARSTGALPALAGTREAALRILRFAAGSSVVSPEATATLNKVVSIADAAAGPLAVSLEAEQFYNDRSVHQGNADTKTRAASWLLTVAAPSDDAYWGADGTFRLLVFANNPNAAVGSLYPDVPGPDGKTIATRSPTMAATQLRSQVLDRAGRSYVERTFRITGATDKTTRWTLTMEKRPSTAVSSKQYRLIASAVEATTYGADAPDPRGFNAHYWSFGGGVFNALADQAFAKELGNPARPAFDGFGLPTHWLPPADPSLFGGQPGEDATSHYLAEARRAADEATLSVKETIQHMIEEATKTQARELYAEQGRKVIDLQLRELCGGQSAKCAIDPRNAFVSVPILANDLWAHAGAVPPNCADNVVKSKVSCLVDAGLRSAETTIKLGVPVKNALTSPVAPSFSEFSGGALQAVFLNQWAAYQRLRHAAKETVDSANAARGRIDLANADAALAQEAISRECGEDANTRIAMSGLSLSGGAGYGKDQKGNTGTTASGGIGYSYSPGAYLEQQERCKAATQALLPEKAKMQAAASEAFAAVTTHLSQFADAVNELQRASVAGYQALQRTQLAVERAGVESALQQALNTSVGLSRKYHSYDAWRSRALLESARRLALTARRAIEAHFVVDLSELQANEPFVVSPAKWADQIYDYDLSMPSSVGLMNAVAQTDGIYPNQVLDYVGNLERFVQGYAVARPASASKKDSEVLTIAGPGTAGRIGSGVTAEGASWAFLCKQSAGDDRWVGPSTNVEDRSVMALCGGAPPSRARVTFFVDPWGRVNGGISNEPYQKRFNARWQRLAVNLSGTGILDCEKAADTLSCYSQRFLRYDLTHVGPSWVTDSDQTWRVLGTSRGQIEGGKALARELLIDPLGEGWAQPAVDAVGRDEFLERPFGGAYVFDLEVTPEVNLDRIERVQILAAASYWVTQR